MARSGGAIVRGVAVVGAAERPAHNSASTPRLRARKQWAYAHRSPDRRAIWQPVLPRFGTLCYHARPDCRLLFADRFLMADFRTHVTFSGCIGVGYAAAVAAGGLTGVQAVLAGCLTGCAGMLPDLDADNGRPLREIFSLTAALVPVLEMDRLRTYAGDSEGTILLAILVYITIRYGASTILAMLSVHRGMFHSIPAAVIAAELAYLAYPSGSSLVKLLMAGGVAIGFLSHLVLDEIYSVQWNGAQVRLKASAGSALKVFGNSMIANATTWGILCTLSWGIASQGQWPTGDVPQPRMAIPAPKPRG